MADSLTEVVIEGSGEPPNRHAWGSLSCLLKTDFKNSSRLPLSAGLS
jgi:hypothetical protein